MNIKWREMTLALVAMVVSAAAFAVPPSAEMLSNACAGCHGTSGASAGPSMPSLAGQSKAFFIDAMKKFKSGERPGTVMSRLAKGYTDEQVVAMAEFFAKQKPQAQSGGVNSALVAKGKTVYNNACKRCHLENGKEFEEDTPVVAGQWLQYLQIQMNEIQNGSRKLLGAGAGAATLGLAGCASQPKYSGGRKVVVIGGGYGGTIAAKYIRMMDATIEVTLIERNDHFVSCPFSNLYLGGILPDLSSLTIKYDQLATNHGIKVVQAEVTGIDAAAHSVTTSKGVFKYDSLIVSPGIEFRTDEIAGYDPEVMPHAWKAGPQTVLLRKQLEAMKPGGTVVLSIPLAPFRCPPGPYERTSMIAMYLKQHKPGSKIIVLDANPDIVSKKGLFMKGWKKHYEGIIDYRPAKKVTEVDNKKMSVMIEGIEEVKGDVINVIPPQKAGAIAHAAGLVGPDGKWCPVNPMTFESTLKKDIHVIGDASIAGKMPKSGYSANSEAKVCATNIVARMNSRPLVELSGVNTCYSFLSAKEAVSVTGVYQVNKEKNVIEPVPGSVGVSPDLSELEAVYAHSWIKNILTEMSS